MEQHDLTLNETIIEEFLSVLRGHVRHQARPLDDLLQGNTFAARHLNCWHGTLTHTVNDTVAGRPRQCVLYSISSDYGKKA
jgi:hypothetical protein